MARIARTSGQCHGTREVGKRNVRSDAKLEVRVTSEEAEIARSMAQQNGESVSQLVRRLLRSERIRFNRTRRRDAEGPLSRDNS